MGTWESEFACVVCFSRVCYFRRVVSFAYSLSVLDDLPMNLVSCIAAVCLHPPLPGDKSVPSDQTFPCLLEVQTNQRVNCQATLTRIPNHEFLVAREAYILIQCTILQVKKLLA